MYSYTTLMKQCCVYSSTKGTYLRNSIHSGLVMFNAFNTHTHTHTDVDIDTHRTHTRQANHSSGRLPISNIIISMLCDRSQYPTMYTVHDDTPFRGIPPSPFPSCSLQIFNTLTLCSDMQAPCQPHSDAISPLLISHQCDHLVWTLGI